MKTWKPLSLILLFSALTPNAFALEYEIGSHKLGVDPMGVSVDGKLTSSWTNGISGTVGEIKHVGTSAAWIPGRSENSQCLQITRKMKGALLVVPFWDTEKYTFCQNELVLPNGRIVQASEQAEIAGEITGLSQDPDGISTDFTKLLK